MHGQEGFFGHDVKVIETVFQHLTTAFPGGLQKGEVIRLRHGCDDAGAGEEIDIQSTGKNDGSGRKSIDQLEGFRRVTSIGRCSFFDRRFRFLCRNSGQRYQPKK